MNASRLKTIVLIVWGMIVLMGILLGFFVLNSTDLRSALSLNNSQTNVVFPTIAATPSLTLGPTATQGVIYLPSATARFATLEPVTPTPIYSTSLPMLQYFSTLPPNADPLTGEIPQNPEILNRRPIAVKISSFPRGIVRPVQSGLTYADLVYEYYIEDGLTRFIAIYYSQDASRAGPVRSGRYFDEYITRMYHAALVFANADERVEKYLLESDLKPLLFLPRDNNFPPFWDSGSGVAETHFFIDTAGVGPKLTDNTHQELRANLFASLLYPKSLPAVNKIYTHYSIYSYNYWEYDPAAQTYKRFSDAADATGLAQGEQYAPHIDTLTGKQLSADNVIVLSVPHIFHNEFDRADQLLDISINGSGDAYIFRNGRMLKATWLRDQINQPIQLLNESAKPVPLKHGSTYYQVIDPESTLNQADDTIEFSFYTQLRKVTPTPTPFGWEPSPTPKPTRQRH